MLCPLKINNNNLKALIMTKVSSEFISEIKVRGFIHQATDLNKLDSILSKNTTAGCSPKRTTTKNWF